MIVLRIIKIKAILVHNPIGPLFVPFLGLAHMKHQNPTPTNTLSCRVDLPVIAGALPIPKPGGPVNLFGGSVWILGVIRAEEIRAWVARFGGRFDGKIPWRVLINIQFSDRVLWDWLAGDLPLEIEV